MPTNFCWASIWRKITKHAQLRLASRRPEFAWLFIIPGPPYLLQAPDLSKIMHEQYYSGNSFWRASMFRESQASNMSLRDAQLCMKETPCQMMFTQCYFSTSYELLGYKLCCACIIRVERSYAATYTWEKSSNNSRHYLPWDSWQVLSHSTE